MTATPPDGPDEDAPAVELTEDERRLVTESKLRWHHDIWLAAMERGMVGPTDDYVASFVNGGLRFIDEMVAARGAPQPTPSAPRDDEQSDGSRSPLDHLQARNREERRHGRR